MKQGLPKGSLILVFTILCAIACKKSANPQSLDSGNNNQHDTTLAESPLVPYPLNPLAECDNAPNYGDTIVYPQPVMSEDYYIYPLNNQDVSGTYLSWPAGLVLDTKTGAINLTQSETGARYSIAFVKAGTTDTCMSQLIVGGAAYMDSVYVLSASGQTAKPYFDANPNAPSVCDGNQGQGCKFDYNNFAHNQGIEIDQKTGFIDLQKTMDKSPFGLIPLNGTTVLTTIYYKLYDSSKNAGQKIQLKMIYYNHRSDIPAGLLATISENQFNTLNDFLLLTKVGKSRPPLVIIVRQN